MKRLIVVSVAVCISGIVVLPWTVVGREDHPAGTTEVQTVPACAFAVGEEGYDFGRGTMIELFSGSGYFYAPVDLPHGSIIRKIRLVCMDYNGSADAELVLVRAWHDEGHSLTGITLATAESSGYKTGYRTFTAFLTSNKYVNNVKCAYYLRLNLPSSDIRFFCARIVYTPLSP